MILGDKVQSVPEPEVDTGLTDSAHCAPPGGGLPPGLTFTPSTAPPATPPPVVRGPEPGDTRWDPSKRKLEVYDGVKWTELAPVSADPPALPKDVKEMAKAFAELEAEQRFVDLVADHDYKTCTNRECFVCKQAAQAKAEGIENAKNKLIDKLYDEIFAISALARGDIGPSEFTRLIKDRLVNLRTLTYEELW